MQHRAHQIRVPDVGAADVYLGRSNIAHVSRVQVQVFVGIGFPPAGYVVAASLNELNMLHIRHGICSRLDLIGAELDREPAP